MSQSVNQLVSQSVSQSNTIALIVVLLTPCSLHVKKDLKPRMERLNQAAAIWDQINTYLHGTALIPKDVP